VAGKENLAGSGFTLTYGGVLGVGDVFTGSFRMKVLDLGVVRPGFDDIFECI
jgi:hypothetical protein